MMDAEDILQLQKSLAEAIERLLTNFKKDGSARKTTEYLKNKKSELEEYWTEFNSNHNKLQRLLKEDHAYFQQNLYSETQKIYKLAAASIDAKTPIEKTLPSTPKTVAATNPTTTATATTPNQHLFTQTTSSATATINQQYSQNMDDMAQPGFWNPAQQFNNFPKLPPIKIPKFSGEEFSNDIQGSN